MDSQTPRRPHIRHELTIADISLPDPEAPIPVHQHVASLNTLIEEMGAIEHESDPDNLELFLREFAVRHDVGYATRFSVLESYSGQQILGTILNEMDATTGPREITDYLMRNADNYLASRVIGHGVLGLIHNTLHYQERGLPKERALGMATIMAAHHPGFPITMVSGFLSDDAEIPTAMRSGLFIDDVGDNPEGIRGRLINVAANKLRLPFEEVAKAAILGYSLDRITPGKIPDAIHIAEDGSTKIVGGEVIQKKYGLVAGDIMRQSSTRPEQASVEHLYASVISRLTTESQAAAEAARFVDQQGVFAFVSQKAQEIIEQTRKMQDDALASLRQLGLTGSFKNLQPEREILLNVARSTEDPSLRYALATYDAVILASVNS